MNETLRLTPPVIEVRKMVSPRRDQLIVLDGGQTVQLPAGVSVSLVCVGVQRNARYWLAKLSRVKGREGRDDLDDFG